MTGVSVTALAFLQCTSSVFLPKLSAALGSALAVLCPLSLCYENKHGNLIDSLRNLRYLAPPEAEKVAEGNAVLLVAFFSL